MVILQTDMSLPKDVTQVKILVKVGGKPYHDKNYIIAPGENWITKLPATLAVVASVDDPTPRVEVTVVGLRKADARVFAQAVTTIPESRTATLFVPIQWLCEGQVEELPKDAGYVSTCEPKNGKAQVCRAGSCEEVTIDEDELKDYEPSDVFGGSDDPKLGLCFDTVKCFESGFVVTPDADCVVEIGVPGEFELNLALFNPGDGDGICDASKQNCYIPLDRNELFGWTYAKGSKATSMPLRAQLPEAVCDKLAAGDIQEVQATYACATKTLQFPTCGPWSSVSNTIDVEQETPEPSVTSTPDAGVDSGLPAPTELLIELQNPGDVVEIGVPVQLQLTAVDAEGGETDVTDEAEWSSDDERIASIDRGRVTGHATGSTRIRAQVRGKVAEFAINVERGTPELLEISDAPESLPVGRSARVKGQATYPGDNTEDVTTVGTWTSSDPNVATVDETGRVVAVSEGTASITLELNGTTSAASEIEVGPAALDSIKIDTDQVGLNEYQLTATGKYSDGSQIDISDEATWEQTSGQEFGTLDANGHLSVTSVGSVGVQVTLGEVSTRVNINVTTDSVDAG